MAPITPSQIFKACWLGFVALGVFAFATLSIEHQPTYALTALAAAAVFWGPLVGATGAGICWGLRWARLRSQAQARPAG